jgi:hypothetical protein
MTLRALVAFVALMALQGCAAGVTAGGGLRVEQLTPSVGLPQQGLRADSRVTVTRPVGPTVVALAVAPSAVAPLDAATTARALVRTTLTASRRARGAVQPSLALGVEQGTTRPSDLGAETLEPLPARETLTSARFTSDLRVAYRVSGRQSLTVALTSERSGGTGADAAVLPSLTRDALRAQSAWRLDARTTLTAFTTAERAGIAAEAPWQAIGGGAQWSRRSPRGVTLGMDVGGVASELGGAMRIATRLQRAASPARSGLDLTLEQGPELDRLDGSVRVRQRARVSFETPRVSAVSFRGGLQAFADRGGLAARRAVGGEVVVRQRLGDIGSAELGMARLVLWEGQGAARGETRLNAGLRILEPTSRCRNSC